jgi:flagellar basal-body rod protein FlgB
MLDSLFEGTDVIQKSMQGLTARQQAIGQNVANADTPGYKRIQIGFEKQLRAAIKGKKADQDDLPMRTASDRHFNLGPWPTAWTPSTRSSRRSRTRPSATTRATSTSSRRWP